MSDDFAWLNDIVIVNESDVYNKAGDLSIFRSLGDACRKLEPWYVEGDYCFALNGAGYPLHFFTDGSSVGAKINQKKAQDIKTLKLWLKECAESLFSVRLHKSGKNKLVLGELEASGILPTTVEGLIGYIGFTR